jgi:hypothetical protein
MYRPSLWFVAISFLLLSAALLAGKSQFLVPVAGSGVVLGYGCAALRRRRKARGTRQHRREQEVMRVEKQRYLLAKEALLDGARRKRLRKQE